MGTMPVPMDGALDPPGLIPRSHFTDPEERRQSVLDTRHLRPARMKTTPPAALARRRREDAAFEAATQKRLKEEREAREAAHREATHASLGPGAGASAHSAAGPGGL